MDNLLNNLEQRLDNFPADSGEAYLSKTRYFRACGRTELGGNHTDHNNGRVLAASINLETLGAVKKRTDKIVRLQDEVYGYIEINLSDLKPRNEEMETSKALIRGVASWFVHKGFNIGGFDATVTSSVLSGSGLSSSASFEVLIGTILNYLFNGGEISTVSIALAGQYAENQYFGKPSGLMDQVACAYGGVVLIDFKDKNNPEIENINFNLKEHGYCLMIVSTGDDHGDLTHEYAAIPNEMKSVAKVFHKENLRGLTRDSIIKQIIRLRDIAGDRAVLRALHFIDENQRPLEMVNAIKRNDISSYFNMVKESGESSQRLLQNLHAPGATKEQCMDIALEFARNFLDNKGAVRVHGGGFGGTIQAYVPLDVKDDFSTYMEKILGKGSVKELYITQTGCGEL